MSDEFYVGYQPDAPPGLGRRMRTVALGLLVAAIATSALVASSQSDRPSGLFEFGTVRTFEGILWETPVPMLEVTGRSEGTSEARLVLVGFGKAGLPDFAAGQHGARVRFAGTLVTQQNLSMIEMNDPDSFEVLAPAPSSEVGTALPAGTDAPVSRAYGEVTLTGELVDTKCYFGVMRPATGKVHRACAIRCLSGGIPPGLLVRDGRGGASVVLLAGTGGDPLEYEVEWAALTVRARGTLERFGELPVLRVTSLERVDGDAPGE